MHRQSNGKAPGTSRNAASGLSIPKTRHKARHEPPGSGKTAGRSAATGRRWCAPARRHKHRAGGRSAVWVTTPGTMNDLRDGKLPEKGEHREGEAGSKNPPSVEGYSRIEWQRGRRQGGSAFAHGPLRTRRRRTSRASGPATNFRDGRSRGKEPECAQSSSGMARAQGMPASPAMTWHRSH